MAKSAEPLTADQLPLLYRYDAETGEVISLRTGNPIGCKDKHGHLRHVYRGRNYGVHRIAWALVHKKWPDFDLDHKGGVGSNNRIGNLRDVSKSFNQQNRLKANRFKKYTDLQGVTMCLRCKSRPWIASLTLKGKKIHVGYFATPQEAHEAYVLAKRAQHPGSLL